MMRTNQIQCFSLLALLATIGNQVLAENANPPISVAILPFIGRGDVKEEAAQVTDLLFAKLLVSEKVLLVERQAINSVFEELKLSKAGLVNPDEALEVGKLTGAKLLITGSVLRVDGDLCLVAKVIGTETSRLSGTSVTGALNADLNKLVGKLAEDLNHIIEVKAASLLPKVLSTPDWLATTKKQLKGKNLPTVTVSIPEHHIGQKTFDPAAQTECEHLLTELGFTIIASENPNSIRADLLIKGEAISQNAAQHDAFVSVKCRVEVQAVAQANGKIVASHAVTTTAIDLAEQIAAKSGLQEAARKLVEHLVPRLVN